MNIGEAVEAMRNGECVRRSGWNGKNMHIYIEDAHTWSVPATKAAGAAAGHKRQYAPCVCLFNAKGVHQPGWVCSQEDLLATDWEVVSQ